MKSISEHMHLEHQQLMSLWERFEVAEDKNEELKAFKNFSNAVLSHMRLEEGHLSPTFNKHLGIEREVTQTTVLSYDHTQISKLLHKVEEALASDDAHKATYAKSHFIRALMKHHQKEEELHYQLFDTIISQKDWEKMLRGKV